MARVSKRLRFEILRRDGFKCRYCGAVAAERELRVDHVIPEALGGPSEPSNLATACDPCNSGKTSVKLDDPVVDDVARDALRWARAMEIAAAGQRASRTDRDAHRNVFLNGWNGLPLPEDWHGSIDAFIRAGLDDSDIGEAIEIAMGKRYVKTSALFKYFCGICWRVLEERRETAATLVHLVSAEEDQV